MNINEDLLEEIKNLPTEDLSRMKLSPTTFTFFSAKIPTLINLGLLE